MDFMMPIGMPGMTSAPSTPNPDAMEKKKIEEDYEKVLKPKMLTTLKEFIDAQCVTLTNDKLNICAKERTQGNISNEDYELLKSNSLVDYINTKSNNLVTDVLNVNPTTFSSYLLNYNPVNDIVHKQSGGIGDIIKSAVNKTPTGRIANMLGADKLASNVASKVTGAASNVASDISSKVTSSIDPTNMSAAAAGTGAGITGSLGSAGSISEIAPAASVSPPRVPEINIKSNKAVDVMAYYNEQMILKFKCDNDVHDYFKTKVIDSIFLLENKELMTDRDNMLKKHLTSVATEVTQINANQNINRIFKHLGTYDNLFNKLELQEKNKYMDDYLILLLELFLYYRRSELLGEYKLIRQDEFESIIKNIMSQSLKNQDYGKAVSKAVYAIKENKIIELNDLSKIKKKETEKDNNETNNQEALRLFKNLFERNPSEEKTGGGIKPKFPKKNTKKRKLRTNNTTKKKKSLY